MPKNKKTTSEHILDALMTGKSLLLSDIHRMVSDASGKKIKLHEISSLMANLRNPKKCQIAHFINKTHGDLNTAWSPKYWH